MSDRTFLFFCELIIVFDETRIYSLTGDYGARISAWLFAIVATFDFILYIAPALRKFINGK